MTAASAHPVVAPKKLIEVALPLDAINKEAAREKSIRHGHPSTLHLWWARRPLAAARAVIFAQLVNDPESLWAAQHPGEVPSTQQKGGFTQRRKHLFALISELVLWENTTNQAVLKRAQAEIVQSWREVCALNAGHPEAATLFNPEKMPGLHDPFAGGGAIPLEAQRLGLEAFASDLNPVAVLINKAMIEIPPRFAARPPVHPAALADGENYDRRWQGAQGLAEDVRRYGAWMRDEAKARIGHLYPEVTITREMASTRPDLAGLVGQNLTVIAWLWARTVKSPNPAFSHVEVPLVSSFVLSSKVGKESWVQPVVEGATWRFEVRTGTPPAGASEGTKLARANFRCILSGVTIESAYIRTEAQAGRLGVELMAIVAEGHRTRHYISPIAHHASTARAAQPTWKPDLMVTTPCHDIDRLPMYGMYTWGDAFTPRQLVALTTFSDLVGEARERARLDAMAAGLPDDGQGLEQGGRGATAYGEALGVYLAFVANRTADRHTSIATWDSSPSKLQLRNTFSRQAIPMTWDFGEGNVFCTSSGAWAPSVEWVAKAVDSFPQQPSGVAIQSDAQRQNLSRQQFVSTDPPYYDNIGYADLSDFFYVWLRRALRPVFPTLFAGMAVPKAEELVATPYRHGTKGRAEEFFLDGMTHAMARIAQQAHPSAPVTIYYAFKQSETKGDADTTSTGWVTFLDAVLRAGFALTGTWPMRTELSNRMVGSGTNALASSIILVCRRRSADAPTTSRRAFQRELNAVLPVALDAMTLGGDAQAPVAPVDLSQAIIGPGMAVFSRYAAVLEADGSPMSVKTALQLINRFLAGEDFDADTRFCLRWFEQHTWGEGAYGEADVLARAQATSVGRLAHTGVVLSGGGKVRLCKAAELAPPEDLGPKTAVWQALHLMMQALKIKGESGSGQVLAAVRAHTEAIRQLAYRLYTLCERRGLAEDARGYNELVTAWTPIETEAAKAPTKAAQLGLGI